MKTYLILTVGTGTAGRESNISEGLMASIREVKPAGFWLVPSAGKDSIAVADIVREGLESLGTFRMWKEGQRYYLIDNHDSLESTRLTIREMIREIRRIIDPADRVVVNPTSGTKQMSAGATIAALDEEVFEIQFIGGVRKDGVVMTGSERLERFLSRDYFRERDFEKAKLLFTSGNYAASAQVLEPHGDYSTEASIARLFEAWQKTNYEKARLLASKINHPEVISRRAVLDSLAKAVRNQDHHALLGGDLIRQSRHYARLNQFEESIFELARAIEHLAHGTIREISGVKPNSEGEYPLDSILAITSQSGMKEKLKQREHHQKIRLGLSDLAELMIQNGMPEASGLRGGGVADRVMKIRNQIAHQFCSMEQEEFSRIYTAGHQWVGSVFKLAPVPDFPMTLSRLKDLEVERAI